MNKAFSVRFRGVLTALTGVGARASAQIVALLVTLVATRFLDPSDFGVFTLASACVMLIRSFLYSGAFEYFMKVPDLRDSSTECLAINFVWTALLSLGLAFIAPYSNRLFGSVAMGQLLLLLIPSNFITSVTTWQEVQFLRHQRLSLYYGIIFTTDFSAGIVAIILLRAHFGLEALVAQTYVRTILASAAYRLTQKPVLSRVFSVRETLMILRWSSPRYFGIIVGFVYGYGADFILNAFFSTAAAGLYRASDRIAGSVADVFAQPARMFSVTILSGLVAQAKTTDEVWPKITLAVCAIGVPCLIGLAVVSVPLVPILLGPKWIDAGPIAAVLCLSKVFVLPATVFNTLLVTHNRQHWLLWQQIVGCIATVIVLVLVSRFGIVDAAWGITGVAAAMTIWQVLYILRLFPASARPFWHMILAVMVPTVFMAFSTKACFNLLAATEPASKWLFIALIIFVGITAWSLAALPFRGHLVASLEALSEKS